MYLICNLWQHEPTSSINVRRNCELSSGRRRLRPGQEWHNNDEMARGGRQKQSDSKGMAPARRSNQQAGVEKLQVDDETGTACRGASGRGRQAPQLQVQSLQWAPLRPVMAMRPLPASAASPPSPALPSSRSQGPRASKADFQVELPVARDATNCDD